MILWHCRGNDMKIFIFGGTTEGRCAAEEYLKKGDEVTVSVATDIGAEELNGLPVNIRVGRLDEKSMETAIRDYEVVIDATHPYAVEATRNIKEACAAACIPYQRIERDVAYEGEMPKKFFSAKSHEEAAEYLAHTTGNILLTTGSKNLMDYCEILGSKKYDDQESTPSKEMMRVYARVLPTEEALRLCEAAGIPKSHIIAMHGPFLRELNAAMIRQYGIEHLVTKQTGAVGGFPEKVGACIDTDIELVVVKSP